MASLQLHHQIIDFSNPCIMAIYNATPDSFYKHSLSTDECAIRKEIEKYILEGAAIVDIGGFSTRPNCAFVSEDEEWNRIKKPLQVIGKYFPDLPISIDTFRPEIAKRAIEHSTICMINDVSGLADKGMLDVLEKNKNISYVLTHHSFSKENSDEKDAFQLLAAVFYFFSKNKRLLLEKGITNLILDPGFGFHKTAEEGFHILQNMAVFSSLNLPILAGISRKSMLYKTVCCDSEEALPATVAAHIVALQNGASILRVHDIFAAKQAIQIYLKTHHVCSTLA